MGVPFTQIPDSLLVPGSYQEIDNSLAGSAEEVKQVLVVGLKRSTGTAEAGKIVEVSSLGRARSLFGIGSDAAIIAGEFLDLNKTERLFVLPLAEAAAGVAAVKTLTVTATSPEDGTLVRYIAGKKVSVGVTSGEAAAAIAADLVAAINATLDMPCEAAVVVAETHKLTLTFNHKGELGNFLTVTAGLNGEKDPAGVAIVVADTTPGSGNPDVTADLEAMGNTRYHYLVTSIADTANIKAFAAKLEEQYTALVQRGGRLFVALAGAVGDSTAAGSMIYQAEDYNCPHVVLIPRGNNPHLPGVWAARVAAIAVRLLADDPAANTQAAEVEGLVATESYSFDERQKLLEAGIATWTAANDGTVMIERLVTSYTEDSDGNRDTSYLDVQVVETVDAIRTHINTTARKRFKTWKLARTNENFGAGSKVMTADLWRSFLVELYQQDFIRNFQWCQDLETYKNSIIAEIQTGSSTRLNYRHRPQLIGQFLVAAGLNQFQ